MEKLFFAGKAGFTHTSIRLWHATTETEASIQVSVRAAGQLSRLILTANNSAGLSLSRIKGFSE
jgi:hypothetical protein